MNGQQGSPAEIPCEARNATLQRIYGRQFRELAQLRRHICSLVPLRCWRMIVEPGCGTGLLAEELVELTAASYTGIDTNAWMLEKAGSGGRVDLVHGDAEHLIPKADAYVSSFFLAGLSDPAGWLKKVRRSLVPEGSYVVFGEYDYEAIREEPVKGVPEAIRQSLVNEGMSVDLGGRLDRVFMDAGFRAVASGAVQGSMQEPDREFLELQLRNTACTVPAGSKFRMSWRVVWGIYSK